MNTRTTSSAGSRGSSSTNWPISACCTPSFRRLAGKVCAPTPGGEHCLRKWIATLEAYRDGITGLLKAARKAVAE
jgi:hypothetical protein